MANITASDKHLADISKKVDETNKLLKKLVGDDQPDVDLDGRWTCDICNRSFASEKSLKIHKTRSH